MPLSLRRMALVAPALSALFLPCLATAPAQAATVTSTGVRCTVVGTPGPDILVGTPRRDVICGRGGDDVIRSGGGDDLVDAGAGRDRVLAGDGMDRVLGGSGSDRILGGAGTDRVLGGSGSDQILGGAGTDRIAGGDGADHIEGDDGADTVSGGDGPDTLQGDAGADTVSGGGQDDMVEGGSQGDDLTGGGGDDELSSGGGADDVDGGPGDNLCIVDAQDDSVRCRYDEEPPVAVKTLVDPGAVDVTEADADVAVRVHATDDTGVRSVQVWLGDRNNGVALSVDWPELVSGTDRDGWWTGRVTVPRWTAPGPLYADVTVTDRQGRSSVDSVGPAVLQVSDQDPDTQGPQMTLNQVTPSAIDVRTGSRDVTVSVHATDPKSGVSRLEICLDRPGTAGTYNPHPLYAPVVCDENPTRSSGTIRDGVWTATLTVPKGSVGATYNVEVYAEDRVSNDVRWYGPEAYQQWVDGRWCCTDAYAFPGDAGRVEVTGTIADATPAWIDAVTASKTELDTLPAADRTHVRVHALDAAGEGEGVTSVEAMLVSDGSLSSDPQFDRTTLELTSGTVTDGWWEGDVVAPQGTPPGTYHLLVGVGDRAHGTMYTDPTGPMADGVTYQPLEGIPTITVVDRRS